MSVRASQGIQSSQLGSVDNAKALLKGKEGNIIKGLQKGLSGNKTTQKVVVFIKQRPASIQTSKLNQATAIGATIDLAAARNGLKAVKRDRGSNIPESPITPGNREIASP